MIWRIITFSFASVIAGILGLWAADREPPIYVIKAEPVKTVWPGDELQLRYTVYRRKSCETNIDRFIFDSQLVRYVLDDLAFSGAPGPLGESTYVARVAIPAKFAIGQARYRVISKFVCNPLQRIWPIVVESPDVVFDVGTPKP